MAVKIRLKRMGSKKKPVYRVVVMEALTPRDGREIENLGRYEPRQQPSIFEIKEDRVKYWIGVGAQATDTVNRLLGNAGIVPKQTKVPKESGLTRKEKKARAEAS